jgi:hypothetical protein
LTYIVVSRQSSKLTKCKSVRTISNFEKERLSI